MCVRACEYLCKRIAIGMLHVTCTYVRILSLNFLGRLGEWSGEMLVGAVWRYPRCVMVMLRSGC